MELIAITPDLVTALGNVAWKIVLAASLPVSIFVLRKQLRQLIDRLGRFQLKRGNMEVVLEQSPTPSLPPQTQPRPEAGGPPEEASSRAPSAPALPAPSDSNPIGMMIEAFLGDRFQDAETAFAQVQEGEPDALQRIRNQALYLALRFQRARDESALQQLRDLALATETRSDVLSWLGSCYRFAKRYDLAVSAYKEAIEAAVQESDRSSCAAALAQAEKERGRPLDGLTFVTGLLGELRTDEARAQIWEVMAELEGALGHQRLRAILLEKVAQARPADTKALFSAAYAQSEVDLPLLSCANYESLLRFAPGDPMAANNLGVECSNLEMPIRSVALYRRGEQGGNTLAMANIAYLLLDRGFADEAKQILQRAQAARDAHSNVPRALAAVGDHIETEAKRWAETLEAGTLQQQFIRDYAEASYLPQLPSAPNGAWMLDNTVIRFSEDAGRWAATWGNGTGARRLLLDFSLRGAEATLQKWETVYYQDEGRWGAPAHGLAYMSRDLTAIRVMVLGESSKPQYLSFWRAP